MRAIEPPTTPSLHILDLFFLLLVLISPQPKPKTSSSKSTVMAENHRDVSILHKASKQDGRSRAKQAMELETAKGRVGA